MVAPSCACAPPLARVKVPSSWLASGHIRSALACFPLRLFNRPIAAPGTEMPSQGANLDAPRQRLLATARGLVSIGALSSPATYVAGVTDTLTLPFGRRTSALTWWRSLKLSYLQYHHIRIQPRRP